MLFHISLSSGWKEKEAQERENKRIKLEKELEETNKEISEEFTDETLDRYSY